MDECSNGRADAKVQVQKVWKNLGGTCSDTWGLQKAVNKMTDTKHPAKETSAYKNSNWRDKARYDCARPAANSEVKAIEKKCLSDKHECFDLGDAASSSIVQDYCGAKSYNNPSNTNFKKLCRYLADKTCKESILTKIRANSTCKVPIFYKLLELQNQCMPLIEKWTPNSEEKKDEFELLAKLSTIDTGRV